MNTIKLKRGEHTPPYFIVIDKIVAVYVNEYKTGEGAGLFVQTVTNLYCAEFPTLDQASIKLQRILNMINR